MVDGPTGIGGSDDDEDERDPSVLGAAATIAVRRQSRRERRRDRSAGGAGGGPPTAYPAGMGPRRPSRFGVWQKLVGALVVILLLAFGPAFVSGLKKTPRNMIGISYGGGPFEGAHFQRVVKPGSALFFNGWYDPLYLYPSDQQNYIISLNPRVGAVRGKDSLIAPTSDRVLLTYQVAVYFKLNTDLLRQFHEQLGLQYKAYTTTGWNNMLQDTFRQQVENAVQQETRKYAVADLYGNARLLVQLQSAVQKSLAQKLISALGQPYFCSPTFKDGGACDPPTFIVKQIDIPSSVVNAFVAVRTSGIQIQVMQNQIKQRQAEAAGIAALNSALSVAGENYVLLKAIESGNINFWVLPSGAGNSLTLPTQGAVSGSGPGSGSGSPTGAAPAPTSSTSTSTGSGTGG
jgi:SPFH domain/Band 7 family protein